jgi:ribosome maturation factor RimP
MAKKISNDLLEAIEETVASCGVEFYDAEFNGRTLRVLITKPEGITVEICANVSQQLSQRLDIENLILDRYFLEVSSPGIERKIRNQKDFQDNIGKVITISSRSGGFKGTVLSVTESGVMIKNIAGSSAKPGTESFVLFTDIHHARVLVSDEELFNKSSHVRNKKSEECIVSNTGNSSGGN